MGSQPQYFDSSGALLERSGLSLRTVALFALLREGKFCRLFLLNVGLAEEKICSIFHYNCSNIIYG